MHAESDGSCNITVITPLSQQIQENHKGFYKKSTSNLVILFLATVCFLDTVGLYTVPDDTIQHHTPS